MKKSPSIIVISLLLVMLAIRLFNGHPTASTNAGRLVVAAGYLVLALLSIATAAELWRSSPKAMRLFGVWAIAYLAVGGIAQLTSDGTPLSGVALWWLLVGALLLAVAAHLHFVRRQAV